LRKTSRGKNLVVILSGIIRLFSEERKERYWFRGEPRCYLALSFDACSYSCHMSVKDEFMASLVARLLPHLALMEFRHPYLVVREARAKPKYQYKFLHA
jgi:hypothetical protein